MESVQGPHTCTRTRAETTRSKDGHLGEGERLTTDAPHDGAMRQPGDVLRPPRQHETGARKSACCRRAGA